MRPDFRDEIFEIKSEIPLAFIFYSKYNCNFWITIPNITVFFFRLLHN